MSGITPLETPITPILPPTTVQPQGIMVDGFILSLTIFILGSIFMLLMLWFIFTKVFGQPMTVAKEASAKGSIIQHFNTSKSAVMKIAAISGGAFRYQSIRDGTVAATSNSVNNVGGRNIVLTFAQLGVTIPITILGAISILVHSGINNLNDLKNLTRYVEVYKDKVSDEEGNEKIEEIGELEKYRNDVIISGYDFNDFEKLLKETEEEKLIPLIVEAAPEFVEKNISADYTEKKIILRQQLNKSYIKDDDHLKIMTIAIAVVIIFIIGMLVK